MITICQFAFVIFAMTAAGGHAESDFTYFGNMGPDHWSEHYNQCAGKHQSPIDINDVDVIERKYPQLEYVKFDKAPLNATLTNNGHTVLVGLEYAGQVPYVYGGPLEGKGKYEFQQLHFHWGEDDSVGSEDRINNVSFPMELHMVFRNTRYRNFEEAVRRDDGISVFAFFYKIDKEPREVYRNLTSSLQHIHQPHTTTTTAIFDLKGLLPQVFDPYYTYMGSLTTPPCSEDVIWLDFTDPIPISAEYMSRFRALKTFDGTPLAHNFRPVQPLNNRQVFKAPTLLRQDNLGSDIPLVDAWDESGAMLKSTSRTVMALAAAAMWLLRLGLQ